MSHKNRMFYNYMTTLDAWDEYLGLLKDDDTFADIWKDTENDFDEWCEAHDIVLVDTQERANQLEEAQLE
jgi:hypothetical protein